MESEATTRRARLLGSARILGAYGSSVVLSYFGAVLYLVASSELFVRHLAQPWATYVGRLLHACFPSFSYTYRAPDMRWMPYWGMGWSDMWTGPGRSLIDTFVDPFLEAGRIHGMPGLWIVLPFLHVCVVAVSAMFATRSLRASLATPRELALVNLHGALLRSSWLPLLVPGLGKGVWVCWNTLYDLPSPTGTHFLRAPGIGFPGTLVWLSLLGAASFFAALAVCHRRGLAWFKAPSQCPACGYARATAETCPECGHRRLADPLATRSRAARRFASAAVALVVVGVLAPLWVSWLWPG